VWQLQLQSLLRAVLSPVATRPAAAPHGEAERRGLLLTPVSGRQGLSQVRSCPMSRFWVQKLGSKHAVESGSLLCSWWSPFSVPAVLSTCHCPPTSSLCLLSCPPATVHLPLSFLPFVSPSLFLSLSQSHLTRLPSSFFSLFHLPAFCPSLCV
jgi:hypothetical protein